MENIINLYSALPGCCGLTYHVKANYNYVKYNAIFLVLQWMILLCIVCILCSSFSCFTWVLDDIPLSNHCMIFGKLLNHEAPLFHLRPQSTFQKCPLSCFHKHVPQIWSAAFTQETASSYWTVCDPLLYMWFSTLAKWSWKRLYW